MIRRPPRSTQSRSSAASDVYKRQLSCYPIDFFAMKLIVTEKNQTASRIATVLSGGKAKREAPRSLVYVFESNGEEVKCLGLRGHIMKVDFPDEYRHCLLYTSDAADDLLCVDL